MAKKVKLGPKANSFFDTVTRLKVAPGQVKEVTVEEAKSPKFKSALALNWLVETDEDVTSEEVTTEEDGNESTGLEKKTVAELLAYLDEEYELDEAERAKVGKLKKPELIAYIQELEKEDEL